MNQTVVNQLQQVHQLFQQAQQTEQQIRNQLQQLAQVEQQNSQQLFQLGQREQDTVQQLQQLYQQQQQIWRSMQQCEQLIMQAEQQVRAFQTTVQPTVTSQVQPQYRPNTTGAYTTGVYHNTPAYNSFNQYYRQL